MNVDIYWTGITWKEQHPQEINLKELNIHFKNDRNFVVLVIMTLDIEVIDLATHMSLSNVIVECHRSLQTMFLNGFNCNNAMQLLSCTRQHPTGTNC